MGTIRRRCRSYGGAGVEVVLTNVTYVVLYLSAASKAARIFTEGN